MNVIFISQCTKAALIETRRLLDQFAERKGERAWQTPITEQGLAVVRKLLGKTARRNTSVACHLIRRGGRTELLWIVGNSRLFNEDGAVPTNTTSVPILKSRHEGEWRCAETMTLLTALAAIFHDLGKANQAFQKKLKNGAVQSEPFRHEWISLRLFEAFVQNRTDREWLQRLGAISKSDEPEIIRTLNHDAADSAGNPFKNMPPLAQAVGWLILSHHRLPQSPPSLDLPVERLKLTAPELTAEWNKVRLSESPLTVKQNWIFKKGETPLRSETWRKLAKSVAERTLRHQPLFELEQVPDRFTMHIARLLLMLSDHYYSAHAPTLHWQDASCATFANTARDAFGQSELNQRLDEHLIGVTFNAIRIGRNLPLLRRTLPAIKRHKGFKRRSSSERFRWQDAAYDLACCVREKSSLQGFFGVNMASTGCGKTFANGKIIYGLSNPQYGSRFNVALGLRTLTLQTGDALRERLGLAEDDLAVLVGSHAVSELHRAGQDEGDGQQNGARGSESLSNCDSDNYVRYDGQLEDSRLKKWLENAREPKLRQLVSAPVLISTIDYLIPATESQRGGRQIAPMLRLLTSDLILDEPDDYDLSDLPALCRLVNWAGLLGSRVLLSSATLPPALVGALFSAYREGRRVFRTACGEAVRTEEICCAWFDEHTANQVDCETDEHYMHSHESFVDKRVERIESTVPIRKAVLVEVPASREEQAPVARLACSIYQSIWQLHNAHHVADPVSGKRVSIGLVRIANIDPLVAIAGEMLSAPPPADSRAHFCIYHSRFPLLMRSKTENILDRLLTRHDPETLWQNQTIRHGLAQGPEKDHVFVVFATAVAEVGRDHDYDWAILEPSSMRSIIQAAGRVRRHRFGEVCNTNIHLLNMNYRALRRDGIAFTRPGFESEHFRLDCHDLARLLVPDQYVVINSIPRIKLRDPLAPRANLADLEHVHLRARLDTAADWWKYQADWSYELQKRSRFRISQPEIEYTLFFEEEGECAEYRSFDERGELKSVNCNFLSVDIKTNERVSLFGAGHYETLVMMEAEKRKMGIDEVCRTFGRFQLPTDNERVWRYHALLGFHREVGKAPLLPIRQCTQK